MQVADQTMDDHAQTTISHRQARMLAFATKGSGTNEERRLRRLLSGHSAVKFVPYDKQAKWASFRHLLSCLRRERPQLLFMEGTGIAGGAACLLARLLWRQRYVVSSGDAVGPFVGGIAPWLGPAFGVYERLLCRLGAGFIGWTPYLTGRALTFGVPRAMTAAGWSEQSRPGENARHRVREQLGIPSNAIVFGLVGALVWNRRHRYCYGMELVRAIQHVDRPDVRVLIVGDGSGLSHLREAAGELLDRTVLLPGAAPADRVIDYMAAMDVGSLPQSVDGVGSFRYTTKLSEYLAAGLPVATGTIPLAYDLGEPTWLWRLRGPNPWADQYVEGMRRLLVEVTAADVAAHRAAVPSSLAVFDVERQVAAVTAFVADMLHEDASVRANR